MGKFEKFESKKGVIFWASLKKSRSTLPGYVEFRLMNLIKSAYNLRVILEVFGINFDHCAF